MRKIDRNTILKQIENEEKAKKKKALEMAAIAQEKIKGKELVPHPTLKNTWIYE
jgi:hypothetical protein